MFNGVLQLLNLCDGWLAMFLPDVLRVGLWGGLSGVAALGLYTVVSNQDRIAALKGETRRLRTQMRDATLTYGAMLQLNQQNLTVSLRLLGHTLLPGTLSAVPPMVCMMWISLCHTYTLPPAGQPIRVTLVPELTSAVIEPSHMRTDAGNGKREIILAAGQPLRIVNQGKTVYEGRIAAPPLGQVHKKHWWNALVANEAGYIYADAPIDEILFDLPRKRFVAEGPLWLATWEFPFFLGLTVATVTMKLACKIA
jgi:hypothetical protein